MIRINGRTNLNITCIPKSRCLRSSRVARAQGKWARGSHQVSLSVKGGPPPSTSVIFKLEGEWRLRLWSFGANWVEAVWGAELSAGGRDRVSSLAPASLRRPPPGRARRKLTAPSLFSPPPPRTQVLAPVPLGTLGLWDPLSSRKPEGTDELRSCPALFT